VTAACVIVAKSIGRVEGEAAAVPSGAATAAG
jgi:hypothetical protein